MTNPLTGGFRIRHSRLSDAMTMMDIFREQMFPVVKDASATALAREAATRVDSMLLRGEHAPDHSPLSGLYSERWNMEHENRHAKIGSWAGDLRANMVLIPHKGDIVGIFQAGQPEWQDLWRAIKGVEAFDLVPGSAPAEDLAARRSIWATLLGKDLSAPVQMIGLEKTIHHGDQPVHDADHLAKFCPDHDWRVDAQVRAQIGEAVDRNSDAYRSHCERIAAILPHKLTAEILLDGPACPTEPATPAPGDAA